MELISIASLLKKTDQTELIKFKEFVLGLETLTPVKGYYE